jgi:hypothetical protein
MEKKAQGSPLSLSGRKPDNMQSQILREQKLSWWGLILIILAIGIGIYFWVFR